MAKKQKPTGRPSEYSFEIAAVILHRLKEGQTLRTICKDPELPSRSTIYRWLDEFPEFWDHYVRAREIQADNLFDEILEIADLSSSDYRVDEFGNEKPDHEHIQRSKLRVDTRKWYLAKVLPKRYGDKTDQESNDKESPGFNVSPDA